MAPLQTDLSQDTEHIEVPTLSQLNTVNKAGKDIQDNRVKLVGVHGYWYDVTSFIDRHPGGPILHQFIGKDCTTVFKASRHPESVLKHRKPVGVYKRENWAEADEDFDALLRRCEERGWFKTDWSFYMQKSVLIACTFVALWACVLCFDAWYMHYAGAVCLTFLWQQSGYFMHDFMHGQVFRSSEQKNRDMICGLLSKLGLKRSLLDRLGGMFFGTVLFGMSAHWWQEEHVFHHGLTNVVDVEQQFADPQMLETVWAQSALLFPLFKGWLHYCLIKIQHITFIPVVVFCGRFEMITHSYRLEYRWYEWVGIILHWAWVIPLLSHLPTWREVIIFYFIAASIEGISHFQLILSHYCREFQNSEDFHKKSWYVAQVVSNMNISCPWWLDWYYGGLNFHIEHHLFPKLARKYLRRVAPEVEAVCQKHGIEYGMKDFTSCMILTLKQLKNASTHYKLDPR